MNSFPDEILVHIFDFCEFKDLKQIRLVCTRWEVICKDKIKPKEIRIDITSAKKINCTFDLWLIITCMVLGFVTCIVVPTVIFFQ